ncbi:MAG TPA: hypothetical protein VIU65_12440 [Pyrinomonadaceae bacterium]
MKKLCICLALLLACAACAKKTTNSSGPGMAGTGTKTESQPGNESRPGAESTVRKDMSGTWIATEGPRTWELVITPTGSNTWTTTPTLVSNTEKEGLVNYGPPGSKGDTLIIVGDGPGKFKVRYAEKKNFHTDEFWPGTGTYDDNTFNFAGYYMGKRKA